MDQILVAGTQMVRAFALWDRRFREDPSAFKHDVERIVRGETPEAYGAACAEYFKSLLVEAR